MKRNVIIALALTLFSAVILASCGQIEARSGDTVGSSVSSGSESSSDAAQGTKGEARTSTGEGVECSYDHQPSSEDNIVEHEEVGYCGNMITTIMFENEKGEDGKGKTVSFYGDGSVDLSDFLKYLDYKDAACGCPVEYTVSTELLEGTYGINLTKGFVRCGDKQVQLAKEQLDKVREIIEIVADGGKNGSVDVLM